MAGVCGDYFLNIYSSWGFRSNPFLPEPLAPTEDGNRLMVGRDSTLRVLKSRIATGAKISTIEGLNGIGKTSFANIAAYQLYKESTTDQSDHVFLPCRKVFQINDSQSPSEFRKEVLFEVMQTLIDLKSNLLLSPGHTRPYVNQTIDRWLNSSELVNFQVGFLGTSLGGGRAAANTEGFSVSGFEKAAISWLKEAFPAAENGGVIVVIDNLELLKTSSFAASKMEELRDYLFTLPGIRWVMCGALGIVHGVVSSPRLDGYLHEPIELRDVSSLYSKQIFETRVASSKKEDDARLPVTASEFNYLFELFSGNLRGVLGVLGEYCQAIWESYGGNIEHVGPSDFNNWLEDHCERVYLAVERELGNEGLWLLARVSQSGSVNRRMYAKFKFSDEEAFNMELQRLCKCHVIVSIEDESDHTRDSFRVIKKGRLVVHHMKQIDRFYLERSITPDMPRDESWYDDGVWSGETETPNEQPLPSPANSNFAKKD